MSSLQLFSENSCGLHIIKYFSSRHLLQSSDCSLHGCAQAKIFYFTAFNFHMYLLCSVEFCALVFLKLGV